MTRDLDETMMKNKSPSVGMIAAAALAACGPVPLESTDAGGYASGQRVRVVDGSLYPG